MGSDKLFCRNVGSGPFLLVSKYKLEIINLESGSGVVFLRLVSCMASLE